MTFVISQHAAERYIERIEPGASLAEAREAIRSHARAIEAAVSLGCHSVRMGEGWRIVLKADQVVTVLPAQPKKKGRCAIMRGRNDFRATRGFSLGSEQ